MSLVKICGIQCKVDVLAINRAKPDFMGFVFAESRRQVTAETAEELGCLLSSDIKKVGVFVNPQLAQVESLVRSGVIDLVQLHGQESTEDILTLQRLGIPVIKSISVSCEAHVKEAEWNPADYLLFDHGAGGTGEMFPWSYLQGFRRNYFLAGGLSESNLCKALSLSPYCVDVSSGVENLGRKDPEKIRRFVSMVRAYEATKESGFQG